MPVPIYCFFLSSAYAVCVAVVRKVETIAIEMIFLFMLFSCDSCDGVARYTSIAMYTLTITAIGWLKIFAAAWRKYGEKVKLAACA